jgi:hypothetical protein
LLEFAFLLKTNFRVAAFFTAKFRWV